MLQNEKRMKNKLGLTSLVLLLVAFLIYSTTGIFTKLASKETFLSFGYLSFFAMVIISMGIYAVLWQIILKRVPLTQAYLFKSMTVVFSLLFAYGIFSETITWKNLLGASFIVVGIIVNSQSKADI